MINRLLLLLIVVFINFSINAQTDSSSIYNDSNSPKNPIKKNYQTNKKTTSSNTNLVLKNSIIKPKYDKFGNPIKPNESIKQIPKQPSIPQNYLDYKRYQGRTRYAPSVGLSPQKASGNDVRNNYSRSNITNSKTPARKYPAPVRIAKRAPKRIVIIDSLPKEDSTIATTNKNLNSQDSTYLKSALGMTDTLSIKDTIKKALIITPEEMVYHKDSIIYYKTSRAYGIKGYALPAMEMKCLLTTDPNAAREYKYFQKNAKPGLLLVSLGMIAGIIELVKFHNMDNQIINPYFITFSLGEIIGSRLLFKADKHLQKSVSTFNKYVK